tara:strand:+ start:300 stop:767 length:468 start_codon:yes stop_codon:yes gene_type:complete
MPKFHRIDQIQPEDETTWLGKVLLTFDIDWCTDDLLREVLDLLETRNAPATFFATHETGLLDRIRSNELFELAVHPNFNPLLSGDFRYGKSFQEVIAYYKKLIPDATSVRSHSMTQNSSILYEMGNQGYRLDCNHFIPYTADIPLKPWPMWKGGM